MPMEKKWDVKKDLDVIEERGNSYTALKMVSWYGGQAKLELRRWRVDPSGEDTPAAGCIFMTDDGPHKLAESLVHLGYGDTKSLFEDLKKRNDCYSMDGAVDEDEQNSNIVESTDEDEDEEEFYDPKQIF